MKQINAEQLIKQRVLDVLTECKLSVNRLAISFEASTRTLNDQINGSSKITAATLIALADFCPDLSAEWLLRGTGSMLLTEPHHETLTGEIRDDSETIAALKETIAAQKIAIAALTDEVHILKGDIVVPHRSVKTV